MDKELLDLIRSVSGDASATVQTYVIVRVAHQRDHIRSRTHDHQADTQVCGSGA